MSGNSFSQICSRKLSSPAGKTRRIPQQWPELIKSFAAVRALYVAEWLEVTCFVSDLRSLRFESLRGPAAVVGVLGSTVLTGSIVAPFVVGLVGNQPRSEFRPSGCDHHPRSVLVVALFNPSSDEDLFGVTMQSSYVSEQ
jgi:hypothetical protein